MSRSHNHKKWYRGKRRASVNNLSCRKYKCPKCGSDHSKYYRPCHYERTIKFHCTNCHAVVYEQEFGRTSYTKRKE